MPKIKRQKFLKLAPTYCPTVTVQSKQLLLCGTAKWYAKKLLLTSVVTSLWWFLRFLDASSHLYMRVCPSVSRPVCLSPVFSNIEKKQKMNKKLKGEGRGREGGGGDGGRGRGGEEGRGRGGEEGRGGKEKKSEDASLVCLPNLFTINCPVRGILSRQLMI